MDIVIRVDEETGEARTVVDGALICSHASLAGALRRLLDRVEAPGSIEQCEIVRGVARREAKAARLREAAEVAPERSPAEYVVQMVTSSWERNGDGEAEGGTR